MTKTPAVRGLLAGFVLLLGSVTQTIAQTTPKPVDMLAPQLAPKHDDVTLTTPSVDELQRCAVELIKGSTPGSAGWLLKDGSKRPLRRFFDSNGDGKVDVWSYYKDGVEVYREFDATYKTGRPDNFRWLNAGGMKWGVGGVDSAGKAYIEYWRMISAEEVGFEAFQAIAKNDFGRLKNLFLNDAELQALKLSAAASKRISVAQQSAPKKFEEITKKVNLTNARFERVEGVVPSCILDDSTESIIIKYSNRPILYEIENKKHDWLHTGEIIQVGMAWRLVNVPSDVDPGAAGAGGGGGDIIDPPMRELSDLYDKIAKLDEEQPPPGPVNAKRDAVDSYYRKRIALVQKIIPLDKADKRETWYKQLFDNLTSMSQNSGDEATIGLLKKLGDDVAAQMPGSNLAAYGAYRLMWTRYALNMGAVPTPSQKEIAAIQEKWLDNLADFVKKYPKATDDTPEALHQLAIGCEFGGKDEEAKRWYSQLFENFPEHGLAGRAKGSVARLNLPGRELKLTAPQLQDSTQLFDVSQLRGKIVIVHYWASYSSSFADDFVRLKRVMEQIGPKHGVELVCVNLDDSAKTALEALKGVNVKCYHLFQAPSNNSGGLNSPLAVQYGIHMLPTMFMMGKDGRVSSRSLQISDIETELKKVQ